MRLHVAFTPADLKGLDLKSWRAVIIDVVRASSTISQAVANGACVIPVVSIAEAKAMKKKLGKTPVLLGGERGGVRIKGFDLANSPREYTAKAVKGKTIVFMTTNGTRAMRAASQAKETLIGSFLNQGALARHLKKGTGDIVIVCAGREKAPVLDDTVCAGSYVERLLEAIDSLAPMEEAAHALAEYERYRGRVGAALRESPSGKALLTVGLGADLASCARIGVLNVVPVLTNGMITGKRGK